MKSDIIGNYRIEEKIGEGGMGTVYKGVDLNLHRPVAIKILHPHLLSDPMTIDRFRAEARTLASLNHSCLAVLYNFLEFEDTYAMIMEYVEGQTMLELIKTDGPLEPGRAIALMSKVLEGLQHAHVNGIIHRDIKPSNIIVTAEDQVKVMDFGIARIIGSQRLTRTGTMIGTLEYMAPEQVKGSEGDIAADIYSSATVLYELITGVQPFEADNEFDLIQKKVTVKPTHLSQNCHAVSRKLASCVMKALKTDPADRYPTALAFSTSLQSLDTESVWGDEETSTQAGLMAISEWCKSHIPGRNAIIGAGLTLVLTMAFLLFSNHSETTTLESPNLAVGDTIPTTNEMGQFASHQVSKSSPSFPVQYEEYDSLFLQAMEYFENEQWVSPAGTNAYEICQRLLENNPGHQAAEQLLVRMAERLEARGDLYEQQRRFDQAVELYTQSLQCSWSEEVETKKQQVERRLDQPVLAFVEDDQPDRSRGGIKKPGIASGQPPRPLHLKVQQKSPRPTLDVVETEKKMEATDTVTAVSSDEEGHEVSEPTQTIEAESDLTESNKGETDDPQMEEVTLGNGEQLTVALQGAVSSEDNINTYDQIKLQVTEPIVHEGLTIVARGTPVWGQVTQVKSIRTNAKAVLEIEIQELETNGENIPLKAGTFRLVEKGKKGAYFVHNQQFNVKIDGDHSFEVPSL